MGKRGPAPAPTSLRVLRGEKRPSRIRRGEPVPPEQPVEIPDYLDAEARAEWQRLEPSLTMMGLLTAVDVGAFGAYCTALVHHRRAVRLVNETNPLIVNHSARGPEVRKHPAMQVIRDQAMLMVQLGSRFGLTPSDRSQFGVVGVPPGGRDAGLGPERLLS